MGGWACLMYAGFVLGGGVQNVTLLQLHVHGMHGSHLLSTWPLTFNSTSRNDHSRFHKCLRAVEDRAKSGANTLSAGPQAFRRSFGNRWLLVWMAASSFWPRACSQKHKFFI